MTINEKFANEVMSGFRTNFGKGSVYCVRPLEPYVLIVKSVIAFSDKHPDSTVLIGIKEFTIRNKIIELFNRLGNNVDNYKITFLTENYINPKYNYNYDFAILIGVNNIQIIRKIKNCCKFVLCIFTEHINNQTFIQEVRSYLPDITTTVTPQEAKRDLIYLPVEETQIGVELNDEDKITYNKCNDYITKCVSVFGDLGNIKKCKEGDVILNISASEFRYTLAKENGWSETLDTTQEIFKRVDDIYNPNNLFEKACNFYNIAGERRNLLTDNKEKLKVILDICENNKDKKILIFSKRAEYAAEITKYITEHSQLGVGDYHECIEDTMLIDDYGNPILIKSGANAGKPKIIKAQALSTINLGLYNSGKINILSTKYSAKNDLTCDVNIVIITDGIYDNITDIRTRFSNIYFLDNPTIVYRLYCNNTVEAKKLLESHYSKNINIIRDEEKNVIFDEKSGDIIL